MQKIKDKIDEYILTKIIAAAYKDAGLIDRIKVYFLTKKNADIKRVYNEYRTTAKKIKNIQLEVCPDSIIELIKIKTKKEKRLFILKPVYPFAVTFFIVTILAAILIFKTKEEKTVYTKAEIELAEEQVKNSLAIVNKIFKKTGNLINDDVLPKRVGKPIHKSLTIINDVLTGG